MSKKETTEVSAKSTENEILQAYQELLEQIQENKNMSHQEKQIRIEEEMVVQQASGLSVDSIVNNLASVKLLIGKNLDTLEQNLNAEYRKLSDLQSAIKIETKNLQELYEIKRNADSLAALLLAQKEYKNRFEHEMETRKSILEEEVKETKTAWKREQELYELEQKEQRDHNKKMRQREEEEYKYITKLERKKDQDLYDSQKAAQEKELIETREQCEREFTQREAAINEQEQEIVSLKTRVELFPKELEKAIRDTEKTTHENLERTYTYQNDLMVKEVEGERRLNQQIIESLRAKIKEQDEFIKQLTSKANEAGHQVQSIAIKALESSSAAFRTYAFEDQPKKQSQINV